MARTLVNAHQLAPFSGSSATEVVFNKGTYSAGLSMDSGSITDLAALSFDGGGKLEYSSHVLHISGAVKTASDLTVEGNLIVNGSTVTIDSATIAVEDSMIEMARSNDASDSLDIGFYGMTGHASNPDEYHGLFRDASDGKFRLFKELQAQPTSTVNIGGTGYATADLVVGDLACDAVEIGDGADTTLARASAGDLSVEGNVMYRAGGTDVPVTDGGTGASTASGARTNLGVAIGSDVMAFDATMLVDADIGGSVQAYDDQLLTLAGFSAAQVIRGIADDNLMTVDDADAADNDFAKFTANGLEGRSYAEVRSDLALEIGTHVQAWDAQLDSLAAWSAANVIIGTGSANSVQIDQSDIAVADWASFTATGLSGSSHAEMKAILDLEIGTDVQAQDAGLQYLAGLTITNEATMQEQVGLEIGVDVLAEQRIGIQDNDLVEVDGTIADNDFAKFTANGLEGRSYAEVMSDLSATAAAAFSMNSQQIQALADPTADQHAATKAYVDAQLGASVLPYSVDATDGSVDLDSERLNFSGSATVGISLGVSDDLTWSVLDNSVTLAKMAGITRGSILIGDVSGDPSALANGAANTFLQSDGTDTAYVVMSGDATLSAGVISIGAAKVTDAMINDDVATELAGSGLDDASGVLSVNFARDQVVSSDGAYNSGTRVITMTATPVANSEQVFLNGQLLRPGASEDYAISGASVTLHADLGLDADDIVQIRFLK